MTAQLAPVTVSRFFDNNGAPLFLGKLTTFAAGTSTPLATYVDSTQNTQNTNPIILNFRGECQLWLDPAKSYKFLLQDALGNTIPGWPVDNITIGNANPSYNIIPTVDNLYTLGNTSFAWANVYVGANHAPVLDTTTGNIGYYPRTVAEIAAGVTPSVFSWLESDIRRYGATTAASDNSGAINKALLVSANGGSAAFIPAGIWNITTQLACTLSSCMYGTGEASIINANSCNGLNFTNQAAYTGSRFFSDFQIQGTSTGSNNAIQADPSMTAALGNRITSVLFENISIQNFGQAVFARQFWNCTFRDCFLYNNYQGYYFHGQNIQCAIDGGFIQKAALAGSGTAYGILADFVAGESTQSLHVTRNGTVSYDVNIAFSGLYILIENCDISTPNQTGVEVDSAAGGVIIRDCWIQTNSSSATTGVKLIDRGAPATDKVVIDGCTIIANLFNAASIGVYVGSNQLGATISNCTIGQTTTPYGIGVSIVGNNAVVANNTFFVSATPILVSSLSSNVSVGPNTIQQGASQAAGMTNASANITTVSANLPVGTPVQFDATVNGFTLGVTYYVLTSAANIITVGASPGASAITATGSTAVNVFFKGQPVNFTTVTPPGFSLTAFGKYLISLSGFAAAQTGVVDWVANGREVSVSIASAGLIAASTSTAMVGSNLPSYLWPVKNQLCLANIVDNSNGLFGLTTVSSSTGAITFNNGSGGALTAAGNKGLNGGTVARYPYA